jgi:hypothetical protein
MGTRTLIKKSEFAQLANVSPAAIAKACRPGNGLYKALVGTGRKARLDPNHPAAVAYLGDQKQKKPLDITEEEEQFSPQLTTTAKENKKALSLYNIDPADVPDNMQQFADMTIREVVTKFGTDYRMVDYLRALKEIEVIDERRVKSAKARGELVYKELVTVGIIEPIDSAHRKMLTDGAKTIARRAVAMIEAGKPVDDLEKYIADTISSFIKPAKAKIKRTLESVDNDD